MDKTVDLDNLRERLLLGDLKVQVHALEEARAAVDLILEAAVRGALRAENDFVYTSKLASFGHAIVPYVERLYRSPEGRDKRTILAILLLNLGSRVGLSDVLGALRLDDPLQYLAASQLAAAGIKDAAEPIISLIRLYLDGNEDGHLLGPKIAGFILALRKMGLDLPGELVDRMMAPTASKFVRALVPYEWKGFPDRDNT
jgi:hypothetical protein